MNKIPIVEVCHRRFNVIGPTCDVLLGTDKLHQRNVSHFKQSYLDRIQWKVSVGIKVTQTEWSVEMVHFHLRA